MWLFDVFCQSLPSTIIKNPFSDFCSIWILFFTMLAKDGSLPASFGRSASYFMWLGSNKPTTVTKWSMERLVDMSLIWFVMSLSCIQWIFHSCHMTLENIQPFTHAHSQGSVHVHVCANGHMFAEKWSCDSNKKFNEYQSYIPVY